MTIENEVPETAEESTDLRATLEAAFDAAESVPEETAEPVGDAPAPTDTHTEEPASGAARDEKGRFAPKNAAGKAPASPASAPAEAPAPEEVGKAAAKPLEAPKAPDAPLTEVKAPQSWKPAAREHFAKLPAEVQQEVVRRERETATALQEASEARRGFEAFRQAVQPFEAMIRAEGSDPVRAVGALLRDAATLRMAPQAQKAQLVAGMIKNFGIDLNLLDGLLAGEPMPQQAQAQQEFRDPRFDQFLATLQQAQAQQTQQQVQKVHSDLSQFAQTHEFFEDVRQDMADLMEVAARRGLALDFEAAYNRACKLHPEISGVLAQREAAKAAGNARASTQRARAAASSVRSSVAVPPPREVDSTDLRSVLEQSFDKLAGNGSR